ncbi:MAG: hypothetical protein CMJ85_12285 [Planctomycetes bacterium]|jgi:hypothetical protein|nr:hypothetical protein [Planctomycetota bacterium]
MRTSCFCLLALTSAVAAPSVAQSVNEHSIWDRTTEYTSRGANLGSAGFVSQGFAFGFTGGLRTLTGVRYTVQDEDAATRERLTVGFAGLDAAGRPDYANVNAYAANFLTPGGSGQRAWIVTHTTLRQNPIKLPVTCEQRHHVWQFQAASWPSDGASVWMSEGATFNSTLLCWQNSEHREIPRTDGLLGQIDEELGWTSVPSSASIPANRSWELVLSFAEPTLQGGAVNAVYNAPGCPNPNQGYAAIDPDFSNIGGGTLARHDDYEWTVMDPTGQVALLYWSTSVLAGGFPTPFGQFFLDLTDPLMQTGPVPMSAFSGGKARMRFNLGPANSPVRVIASEFGAWSAQALIVQPGPKLQLTNLWTMRTKLVPTGWQAGKARQGVPARLSKGAGVRLLILRNDGRGTLTVQAKSGSTNVGPPTTVCERAPARILVPAQANAVEVSSNKTRDTAFAARMF